MSFPVLEFVSAQRAPFQLSVNEVVIGRSPSSTLILDAAGVAERHARITVDASGVWIENYEADAFTMFNGQRLSGRQKLNEGDRVEIGLAQLVFHTSLDIAVASNAPAGSKAASADRTMIGSEMPAELKKFLESRNLGGASADAPPSANQPSAQTWDDAPPTVADPKAAALALAAVRSSPPQRTMQVDLNEQVLEDRAASTGGVMVGKPDPEPPSNRTVQMAPVDVAKLGLDFASPAAAKPAPAPAPAPPPAPAPAPAPQRAAFKQTMMGIGTMAPPKTGAAPPAATPPAKAAPQQATAFMEAPKLPTAPTATPPAAAPPAKAAPQQATAFMEAPKLPAAPAAAPAPVAAPAPAPVPAKAAPQQATAFMEAPKLPPQAMVQQPQPAPRSQTPVSTPIVAPVPVAAPAPAPMPMSASASSPANALPYTPPKSKGSFGSFSRAFEFMSQMLSLAKSNKLLLKPLMLDLFITTPLMFAFAVLGFFVRSPSLSWLFMAVELFALYFVDYACNSLTCSLMYDYATTGQASMDTAVPRVKKALPGVITFAAVSAALDMASTYARERNDILSKIVLRILRAIWTTATYVIMPALVIEGVSFGAAFGRSKKLMEQDPTGVGAGVVALSIVSYVIAAICFSLSFFLMRIGSYVHPALGVLLGMLVVNLYWSVSGWMKISYSTCFYMWARECEANGSQDAALAPAPLRAALEAA